MSGSAGRLTVRRATLGQPVLERVVAALAARADLPLDRLADAQIVAASLAAGAARHAADGALSLGLGANGDGVELALGPLPAGAGERVVADSRLPGVGSVVDRLVDRWWVEGEGGDETLLLTIGAGGNSGS